MVKYQYVPLLRLSVPEEEVERAKEALSPRAYRLAVVRALNRSMAGGRTDIVRTIGERYMLKREKIRRYTRLFKAKPERLSALIAILGPQNLHISDFGARQGKKGTSFRILRMEKRKMLSHAFIAPGRNSGKAIVFMRNGKWKRDKNGWQKEQIEAKYTTSGLSLLYRPDIVDTLQKSMAARFGKEAVHEFEYRIQRMPKR